MTIRRYIADKDATISNASFSLSLVDATGSNTGAADSLETFATYGRDGGTTREAARIVLEFPADKIKADYDAGLIPDGATYTLKLFNVASQFTVPVDFALDVHSLTQSFEEGAGVDLDTFTDLGAVSWLEYSEGNSWATPGGDYDASPLASQTFTTGLEDLEVDITSEVETWITDVNNHVGLIVKFDELYEETLTRNYYTKRFSGRGSEFFFKRPIIEVTFDESYQDDTTRFRTVNPILPASNAANLNSIYFESQIDGVRYDINLDPAYLPSFTIYAEEDKTTEVAPESLSVSRVEEGLYRADVSFTTSENEVWVEWGDSSDATIEYDFKRVLVEKEQNKEKRDSRYSLAISNLRNEYKYNEAVNFTVTGRIRNNTPNIYYAAQSQPEVNLPKDLRYELVRVADNLKVFEYATYTRLTILEDRAEFELDMELLEPGYVYEIRLARIYEGDTIELQDKFRFRVKERAE